MQQHWGEILPAVSSSSGSNDIVVVVDVDDGPGQVPGQSVKAEGGSSALIVKIEDSDDECEAAGYAQLLQDIGEPSTLEEIEERIAYLKTLTCTYSS